MIKKILFLLMICLSQNALPNMITLADSTNNPVATACIISEGLGNEALERTVANILTNNYFIVVENPEKADMQIKLNCRIKKGESLVRGDMYNFKEYFTTIDIQLINSYNSQILFDYLISDQRTLSPVSSSETTAQNNAIRDVLKAVERELDKKLKGEVANINKIVVQSKPKKKSVSKTNSTISLNDSPNNYKDKKKLSKEEWEALKLDEIACNSVVFQGYNFAKGKTFFIGDKGKLESILYITNDKGIFEYLVSYDKQGSYVDCVEIGSLPTNSEIKTSATVEGDQITVISGKSTKETPVKTIYYISPQLKFLVQTN